MLFEQLRVDNLRRSLQAIHDPRPWAADQVIVDRRDALLCHRSQWRSTMDVDAGARDVDAEIARFRERVTGAARTDDGHLVERYRLLTEL